MSPKQEAYEKAAHSLIKNLEKRQMEGFYFPDVESAVKKAFSFIKEGSTVSYGGSMTLDETGLKDMLRNGNFTLLDRDQAKSPEEKNSIDLKSLQSDYYFMSSNAITLDGELINIDGNGNRVGALIYGPKNVIILAGMNKVAPNEQTGLARVRNFAAVPNTIRLNRNTPCYITGKCENCLSADCICNQLVITRRSGTKNRIKVILIGDSYGY